jgi:methionyl-tRNA formyltransferase
MNVAILTTEDQWFYPFAKALNMKLNNSDFYTDHIEMKKNYDIVFILSYHKIIKPEYLAKNKYNIVIHGSDLPKGRGWAPMFWQILENKKQITFTLFEAASGVDNGHVYFKKDLKLTGYELNDELRRMQADIMLEMCVEFLKNHETYLPPQKQVGEETSYRRRFPEDSKLDINKTIKEQFNLLRIVDNENYPAFFEIDGHKYKLKIEKFES